MAQQEVGLLLDSRGMGGIESHVLQLASGLSDHHVPVSVVFLADYGPHPLKDALAERGIRVITLSHPVWGLWRWIKQARPRLLHSHGYKAGILSRLMGRLCRLPVISTYHAGEVGAGKLAVYDLIDRYTAILAAQCFTVSPAISQRLPVASLTFNNFVQIDSDELKYGSQFAFVGRLSEEKGPHLMLDIARHLPALSFHIYGDGPLAVSLRQQAPPNVTFHGVQPDMGKVWPHIGLLIMPSLFEGLPMAALESMSRGIPVVASQVGALPTLIHHDINGWLLPVAEREAFIATILQWQSMPVDRQMMMRWHAHDHVAAAFSVDAVLPKMMAVYQQVGGQ